MVYRHIVSGHRMPKTPFVYIKVTLVSNFVGDGTIFEKATATRVARDEADWATKPSPLPHCISLCKLKCASGIWRAIARHGVRMTATIILVTTPALAAAAQRAHRLRRRSTRFAKSPTLQWHCQQRACWASGPAACSCLCSKIRGVPQVPQLGVTPRAGAGLEAGSLAEGQSVRSALLTPAHSRSSAGARYLLFQRRWYLGSSQAAWVVSKPLAFSHIIT